MEGQGVARARAALERARGMLRRPTPEVMLAVSEPLAEALAALRDGAGSAGDLAALRRELRQTTALFRHAGAYYSAWAQTVMEAFGRGAAAGYTAEGQIAPAEWGPSLWVEG